MTGWRLGGLNRYGKHRPEGDQEEIQKPADARCEDADHGEHPDDAEDEGTDEDAFGERQVGALEEGRGDEVSSRIPMNAR